ncbi:Na/Pi cotransporter family protein [Roseovarius sp. 10]|jgi:phosphate:Na+ symporter|uniref:Na/Pi cotransporter family protein n=1 Tax=Roseovarius sp. 10 TaxID=3080563 RepID=UPI0029545A10|nr:Na/Pi cotransporter family protein [Roseovarius sp. 10]MBF9026705.1 Na/Pi cotransporter family protein [Rhodobacterales bacterium FZCC0188]MDV7200730.1 Na/Pi cotransporter family protein [Roseovarius sp. 10]
MDHAPIIVALNLAAAAGLLIWAVRLVRTGFERAYGSNIRLWMRRTTQNRVSAALTGITAATLLQSSTAVVLLMAGFMSSGALGTMSSLALVLGADLGSAIVVQVLNSRVAILEPVLLLVGVIFFLRSSRRTLRQVGRIFIGLALIFVSLDLIRIASAPVAEAEALQAVTRYLANDLITAFIVASIFAWFVHSSVAAILLFAMFTASGILPLNAAFAMVLGANLGGAFIAFVLTLHADLSVRRVVIANLLLRGGGAVAGLMFVAQFQVGELTMGVSAEQQVLGLHLVFNFFLVILGLVFLSPVLRVVELMVPNKQTSDGLVFERSALDQSVLDQPERAFSCARREMVEMGNRVEAMLREAVGLFDVYDQRVADQLKEEHAQISRMATDVRVYLSNIQSADRKEEIGTRAFDLSSNAVNIETGSDVIARKLVGLARRKFLEKTNFSDQGKAELLDFYDRVLRNIQQGIVVLMSDDVGIARAVVEQKETIRDLEQELEKQHLIRLREGQIASIETSAIHIDLLRSLKTLNSSFATLAYPLLTEAGELLDSRLASA